MRRLVLGSLVVLAACGAEDDAVRVAVGPSLVFPHALLDDVKRVTLTVYESLDGADCNADGTVKTGGAKPVATKDLSTDCAGGAKFCGDLVIVQSSDQRIFSAQGFGATAGDPLAVGCAAAQINQDALPVTITMRRFVKPAVCGNDVLEPTEQCEPKGSAADPLCDDGCHTKELRLSVGKGAVGTTTTGKPGEKKSPFFLWPAETGVAGKFLAFFTDRSVSPSEVTVRVLSDAFGRYTSQGSEAADYSFFLPNNPTQGFPPTAEANNQSAPAAAVLGSRYFIAFEDDSDGTLDIHLRSMDQTLTAEQPPQTPVRINGLGSTGEAGVQSSPSIAAGTNGKLFVAWQDESGVVRGRTYEPSSGALGPQREISATGSGTINKHVVVASVGSIGWVATWESGNDVKVRGILPDGTPTGTEQKVNDGSHAGAQQHPWIAGLGDGRFAVVWGDRGSQDIFVQRFGADGRPIGGDQAARINDVVNDGDQSTPVVASMPAAGGSYVAAWLDASSGHVRARFLGGSGGFLFNNVDAQNGEFQASAADLRTRANPTVAVGGSGPYVAIGWEDTTNDATKAGVYGRRFPVPTQ